MKPSIIDKLLAGIYALALHAALVVFLVVGLETTSTPIKPVAGQKEIVQATVVDEVLVEQEVARLEKLEQDRLKAEQQRQQQAQQKLEQTQRELQKKQEQAQLEQQKIKELEQKRKQEEQKRLEAEKKRKAEEERQKQAELERQRLEEEKRKAEEERIRIEKEKQKAEAERKRLEEEKRKAEEERKKAEQAKLKAEADRKKAEEAKRKAQAEQDRKAAQADWQRLMEQEERDREAHRLKGVKAEYALRIKQKVKSNWVRPAGRVDGLQCTLRVVVLPGGGVKSVQVVKSSANQVFDRSAVTAVYKADPLPQPKDPKDAAEFRDFEFIFTP